MTHYHGFTGKKRQRHNMWIWAGKGTEKAAELLQPDFDEISKFDPPICIKPAIPEDEYAFIFWNLQRYHDRDYGE